MTITHTIPHRRPVWLLASAGAVALTWPIVAAASAGASTPPSDWTATALLHDTAGTEVGSVTFEGDAATTHVMVELHGVTEGLEAFHGLHVHANDDAGTCDASADPVFSDVGGHWNPTGDPHGHHAGDLPVVYVGADGAGSAQVVVGAYDPADLDGRAVILHAGPDNLANIPDRYEPVGSAPAVGADETTLATGDSGPRYACGLVVVG